MSSISPNELPYPSLNEINFSAFSEATPEYHNELYGFIKTEGLLSKYKIGKSTEVYKRREKNGNVKSCDVAFPVLASQTPLTSSRAAPSGAVVGG